LRRGDLPALLAWRKDGFPSLLAWHKDYLPASAREQGPAGKEAARDYCLRATESFFIILVDKETNNCGHRNSGFRLAFLTPALLFHRRRWQSAYLGR